MPSVTFVVIEHMKLHGTIIPTQIEVAFKTKDGISTCIIHGGWREAFDYASRINANQTN